MKKYLFLSLFFLLSTGGFAQPTFYSVVQAGPSLSFGSNYGYFDQPSPSAKLTSIFGAGFGYAFPKQSVLAETGFYRTFSYALLDLSDWEYWQKPEKDKVYLRWHTWQIPVRLKMKVWQPSEKLSLRAITGVVFSFSPSNFKFDGNVVNVSSDYDSYSFQTHKSGADHKTYSFRRDGYGGLISNCLLETGLELNYQLTASLTGLVSLTFRNGLQTRFSTNIYSEETDLTTGERYSNYVSRTTTDGNALNLNVGLVYSFVK